MSQDGGINDWPGAAAMLAPDLVEPSALMIQGLWQWSFDAPGSFCSVQGYEVGHHKAVASSAPLTSPPLQYIARADMASTSVAPAFQPPDIYNFPPLFT